MDNIQEKKQTALAENQNTNRTPRLAGANAYEWAGEGERRKRNGIVNGC